jgi:SAM-dependent methyltransferase
MSVDFNEHADDYHKRIHEAQSFAGADHEFYVRAKTEALLRLAQVHFGETRSLKVLDVGCGIGIADGQLVGRFAELSGIDMAERAIEIARQNVPGAHFYHYDGQALPFPDGQFDIAFAICVMHHVPPTKWAAFTAEMARVVKPGGLVAIFEHNPNNPLTRLSVARCAFDCDAVLLRAGRTAGFLRHAGLADVRGRYILFFPWKSRIFAALENLLGWLPLGAQYYITGRKL